jgi:pSer/pThr/pTyr-binding forkhead associated (FHA) protein
VLRDGDHVAGRDAGAGIRLDSPKVSRHHARFSVCGASVTVEDLRSKNGTFVEGSRVELPVALKRGDEVRIGPFALVLSIATPAMSTETEVTLPPRVIATPAQKQLTRRK